MRLLLDEVQSLFDLNESNFATQEGKRSNLFLLGFHSVWMEIVVQIRHRAVLRSTHRGHDSTKDFMLDKVVQACIALTWDSQVETSNEIKI